MYRLVRRIEHDLVRQAVLIEPATTARSRRRSEDAARSPSFDDLLAVE